MYRLGFTAIGVPDLPTTLELGTVVLRSCRGPVRTQRAAIQQRVPPPLVFDKYVDWVEVGDGHYLTICEIAATLGDVRERFVKLRSTALTAAGLVASVLDERLFGEQILEDLLIEVGDEVVPTDIRWHVRHFMPRAFTGPLTTALGRMGDLDLDGSDARVGVAARWYLKAMRDGPTPDGFVHLWVALEAIADEASTVVKAVQAAMDESGMSYHPQEGEPSLGKLYGLRSVIVHQGQERSEDLENGYYVLEAITRGLIRNAAGIGLVGWPPQAVLPTADEVLAEVADALLEMQMNPQEVFHPDGLPKPADVPSWQ